VAKGFCFSGPHEGQDVWRLYREDAEAWFRDYGLEVASAFNDHRKLVEGLSDPETVLFYVLAHSEYRFFVCAEGPKLFWACDIDQCLKERGRLGFAFLGNCWSHVKTGEGTTSYACRKGFNDVTTIGYYKAEESEGWRYSLKWQQKLFSYLKLGLNFGDAFDEAVADYPEIGEMVRIAGNRNLTLEAAMMLREKEVLTEEGEEAQEEIEEEIEKNWFLLILETFKAFLTAIVKAILKFLRGE